MAELQKGMTGVLFKNDRRRDGREDPTLRGSCTLAGRRYWISAWTNTVQRGDSRGEKYLALSFRATEERRDRRPAPAPDGPEDDDIPF